MDVVPEDVVATVCHHLAGPGLVRVRATARTWHRIADAAIHAREIGRLCVYLAAMRIHAPAVPHRWLLRYAMRRDAPEHAPGGIPRYTCPRCGRTTAEVGGCECPPQHKSCARLRNTFIGPAIVTVAAALAVCHHPLGAALQFFFRRG